MDQRVAERNSDNVVFVFSMFGGWHVYRDITTLWLYTDKKENLIFLIYKEIQSGAIAKSYLRKGFLMYEEMHKYFPIYEEADSHI
jgi:hypothetical protein